MGRKNEADDWVDVVKIRAYVNDPLEASVKGLKEIEKKIEVFIRDLKQEIRSLSFEGKEKRTKIPYLHVQLVLWEKIKEDVHKGWFDRNEGKNK
jgi:hypothetical protein